MLDRVLRWDACINVRDLGGLPAAHGAVAHGALVRSDALHRLTGDGLAALVAHGVRTVIDMRTPEEVEARPDPLEVTLRVAHCHIAQQTEDVWTAIGRGVDRVSFDTSALERCASRFAAIAEAVAGASEGGVLIHCEVGKDRTGLMTMLLLDLVGTPAREIAADYALTGPALAPLFTELIATATVAERRARLEEEARCRPEVSHAILSWLRKRYGGAEAYLLAGGVASRSLERIRERMLGASRTI